jgi:hypothetical protein
MTATTASLGAVQPAPSNASLRGLDGVNLFLAGILAGFGPYLTAYQIGPRDMLGEQEYRPLPPARPASSAAVGVASFDSAMVYARVRLDGFIFCKRCPTCP